MIYRLEIENFYSVRERQVIDLVVSKKVPDEPGRLVPIHDCSEDRAPRVVALFGANASGKSNVLRAISFIGWFVRNSFQHQANQLLPYQKFSTRLDDRFTDAHFPHFLRGRRILWNREVPEPAHMFILW